MKYLKLVRIQLMLQTQNNGYNNVASFHEHGNRNEIKHNTKLIHS